MKPSSFDLARLLLGDLTGVHVYDSAQVALAHASLVSLAAALGVADETDERHLRPEWFRYQGTVLRSAIEAQALQLFDYPAHNSRWMTLIGKPLPNGLSLAPSQMLLIVNLNLVREEELAALPGLGRKSAARLVAARREAPFTSMEQARRACGLPSKKWKVVEPYMEIGPTDCSTVVALPDRPLRALVEEISTGKRQHAVVPPDATLSTTALILLCYCATLAMSRPVVHRYWAPSPRRMALGVQSLVHYPDQGGGFSAASVALLRNAAYLRLLRQLIETATMKIRVTMFFFSASDQSPGRELALTLEAACRRGVEVQVILGHDLPGDPHGARRVNQNIRRVLRELNVPYRLYWPEVALHEKSIVIDGRYVLVGSHNWTTPSFYQYDETSVYADSNDLAAALEERFEARWLMLHERTAARQIPLAGLSLLDGEQRRRLEAEDIHLANKLPAADDALEVLAKRSQIDVNRLILVRDVARLMKALRIAEITAAALTVAGLNTPTKVRAASKEALEKAISDSQGWPSPFTDCRIFPGVIERFVEVEHA